MAKLAKSLLLMLFLAVPTLGAMAWTCHQAALAVWAIAVFKPVALPESDWEDPLRLLDLRRQVQRHFLEHSVYIPMEDIVTNSGDDQASGGLSLLMQKACGPGRLYIWIPFKFHLPVTGEKVIEWCWKPQTNAV